jgi:hypothetical protein
MEIGRLQKIHEVVLRGVHAQLEDLWKAMRRTSGDGYLIGNIDTTMTPPSCDNARYMQFGHANHRKQLLDEFAEAAGVDPGVIDLRKHMLIRVLSDDLRYDYIMNVQDTSEPS